MSNKIDNPLSKDVNDIHKFADESYKRNFKDFMNKRYTKKQLKVMEDFYEKHIKPIPLLYGYSDVIAKLKKDRIKIKKNKNYYYL